MDVYENLVAAKLDNNVNIGMVLRDAQLRDNLLANSQQFESNNNKLRSIIQAYLNSNKGWIANDFRCDTKESEPMEVDYIGKGQRAKCQWPRAKAKTMSKAQAKAKGKRQKAKGHQGTRAPGQTGQQGATRGQQGGNKGATRGQQGGNKGATRGQQGGNKGATRGQQGGNKGAERGQQRGIEGQQRGIEGHKGT